MAVWVAKENLNFSVIKKPHVLWGLGGYLERGSIGRVNQGERASVISNSVY